MSQTSILVVEDETIIAKGIEKRLREMGYAVVGVASAGCAVDRAAQLRPEIILMNIDLGHGTDGVDLVKSIQSRVDIPVVFLTAQPDTAAIERANLTEPFAYVLKPYEARDLQTAIEIGLYRHRIDRRIKENEQWLAATLSSFGDGVIATDGMGRVRFMNGLAEQLTGWTLSDALGKDLQDVFNIIEENTRQSLNPLIETLENGRSVRGEANTILVDRDGVARFIHESVAPIRDVDGRVAGAVLAFRDVTKRRSLEQQLDGYRQELEQANARLETEAASDPLTGLKNRRCFEERLDEEVKRASRAPLPLSLLLVDVDDFKQFKNAFNQADADEVLRRVARLLEVNARTTDFVARYGGEKFAVLLPNTDQTGAMVLAERVRQSVTEQEWPDRPITVSVGAATLKTTNSSLGRFFEEADAALYWSKRSGRNCVHHAAQLQNVDSRSRHAI
jgi:diguanylate cyclase (GGDEF)-like protein/PAS domain S-box-containing protein